MKLNQLLLAALCAALSPAYASAQPGPGGPPPGEPGRHHRPPPPLFMALDTNTNGIIDADEIANASKSLLTLDKNGDGKLTADELRPAPPKDQGEGEGERRFGPPPGMRPPPGPLMRVLDTNHDGELDATEIANASANLLKLDANKDGSITKEELRPKGPRGRRGGAGRSADSDEFGAPGQPDQPGDVMPPGGPEEDHAPAGNPQG